LRSAKKPGRWQNASYDTRVRGIYREGKMVFPTTIVFKPDGTLSSAWKGNRNRTWFEYERKAALGEPTD
jgi:hypothetical protein